MPSHERGKYVSFIPPVFPGSQGVDANATVETDLPCRKCAYNLRGLASEGRCPECGSAIGLSLQGDLLRYSDPAWVRTLKRGVSTIILAIVIMVFVVIASIFVAVARSASISTLTWVAGTIAAYACYLIGSWMLTTPDPSGIGENEYGTARKIIRITLAIGVADSGIDLIPALINLQPSLRMMLQAAGILASICGVIGTVAQLQYLERLALRIPDVRLSSRAGFLKTALPTAQGILILVSIVSVLTNGGQSGPGMMAMGCIVALCALAYLVFGIIYLLLLEKLGKRFGVQAEIASQTWARITSAGASPHTRQ